MKGAKHKYYVVQFLKKPYENVDDYVCVPWTWISSRKKSHSRVFVRYPSMKYPSMKKFVGRRRKFRKEWKFYLADVAFHTDLYSEAVSVIKTMKFNYQSNSKQKLCAPQSIVPTKTDVQGVVKKAYSPDDKKEETYIIKYLENENHATIESLNIKNNLLDQELQMQNINIRKDNELNKIEKKDYGKRSMIHEINKQNTNYTKKCRQVLNNLKENKYPSHFTSTYKSHLQTRNNTLENVPNFSTLYDVDQSKNINFTSHFSEPVDYVNFQPNYDHYIYQNLHLPEVAQKSDESNKTHQRTCPERSKHCDITGYNYYTGIVSPLRQSPKSSQYSQLPFHDTDDIYLEPRDKTLSRQSHAVNHISQQIELSQKNEMNMLTIQKPIYNCLPDTFVERSIEANEINKIAYPETVVNDSKTRYSFTNFANQPSHSSKDNSDQLVFPQRLTENYSTIVQPNPNYINSTGSMYSHVKQFSTDVQEKLYQEMSSLETSKRSTDKCYIDKLVGKPLQKYFPDDGIADKDFELTIKQRSPSIHRGSLYRKPYVDKTNLKKYINLDNSELSNNCENNMQNKPVNTQNAPNVSNESLYTDASTKQTFLENILVILEKTNTSFTNTCNYMLSNEHKNQNSEGYEWIEALDLLRLINQNGRSQNNNPTSFNSEDADKKQNKDNNKELNLVISMLMTMIVKLNMLIHMMAIRKLES